jgi:large subunit ribosomal protein L29
MSPDEMQQKLKDLKEELFNLRFQLEVGQLENSARLKQTKKDIARVRTVLRQSELQQKEA